MKKHITPPSVKNWGLALILSMTTLFSHAQFMYTQSTCEFAPLTTAGITLCLGDDIVSSAIPLGFTFSFYGTSFSNCFIGSNGFLTFSAGVPTGCCGAQTLPNALYPNTIFFGQSDLNPNACAYGTITYSTMGVAGSHIFVVSFTGVPHYPGPANFPITVQVQLYESTGEIRIESTHIPNTGSGQTMGLNLNGATADVVPGRNNGVWGAENECISFNGPGGPTCIPGVPTGLFVDNITSTKAKLHWSTVAGVDKYNVSVYTIGGVLVTNKMTTLTEVTVKDLLPGTDYAFKVKSVCVDEGTQSSSSAPASFTTLMRLGYTDDNITIFPNPNSGQFTINVSGEEQEVFELHLINATGQMVYVQSLDLTAGNSAVQITAPNLPAGMYTANLTSATKHLNYSIIISE